MVLSILHENTSMCGETLRLDFTGKESTWHTSRGFLCGEGRSSKERIIFEELRDLYEFGAAEELPKGMKSYPFSIFLPGTMAPSMIFEDPGSARGDGCELFYTLRATLGANVAIERKVKIVGATCTGKMHPEWVPPTCLSPKGAVSMDECCMVLCANVENTHVGRGDELTLSLACRNFSRFDIQRVDVRLEERIRWETPGPVHLGHHEHEYVKALQDLRDVCLEGLKKEPDQSHPSTWKNSVHDEVTVTNVLHAEMTADVHSECNHLPIKVPNQARVTYDSGKLIHVEHSLTITLVARDKSNDPHVVIPIKIMDPQLEARQTPSVKARKVATTVWPEDPVPGSNHHREDSGTFPAIKEMPGVK